MLRASLLEAVSMKSLFFPESALFNLQGAISSHHSDAHVFLAKSQPSHASKLLRSNISAHSTPDICLGWLNDPGSPLSHFPGILLVGLLRQATGAGGLDVAMLQC